MRYFLRCLFATTCLVTGMLSAATPRTISINFGSGKGEVTGEYGIVPSSSWNNFSADKQTTAVSVSVSDGTTGVTAKWWSANIWQWTTATDNALKGYLDDGGCGDGTTGAGPHIAIMGIPFQYYDVIVYYATDESDRAFNPAAFKQWTDQSKCGDTSDSYDGTSRAARNNTSLKFGASQQKTAIVGKNVSYLKRCFSFKNLDIKGGANANGARGGIAAIQIVECDPHESEMYFNRQAGALLIPAATYGTITLSNPVKATQYASQTTLPLTGSTVEIGGDAQYVQGQHCNTRTHSVSGWFRCDGLAGEKMLYAAIAYKGGHGGYKVVVDANGAINVGKCDYYGWNGTALKSANGVIKADTWYYITVAVDSAKPDAATATAKVFVNGADIGFPTGTFATNLNGNDKTIEFSVGGGISVAGLYADFSAIGAASLSQSLAVNPKYVAFKGTDYTATISSESATFSGLTWDPAHPEPFGAKDALTVKVAEGVARTALNVDTSLTAGQLAVVSGVDFTLTQKAGTTVTIPTYDFSGVTGKLTLGISPAGSTVTFSQDPNVFFDCEYAGAPPVERGTLEYRNAALKWDSSIAGTWTLKSAKDDALTIDTTSNMRPTFKMDVSGGSVTFDPNGKLATAWYGENGQTTYNQTGGEVRFNVTGKGQSGTGNGLLLGYTGAGSTPLVLDFSGGLFAVENSSLNLFNAVDMNVTGGRVRAKGVFAGGGGAHTIDVASGAVFELGSLGWRANAATFTLGGTLKAYENAVMENAITHTDGARLTAASGKSLLIKGAITGEGTITCGDATDDGDVVFMGVEPPAGIAGTYYYGYEVNINMVGKFPIPEGVDPAKMRLFNEAGEPVPFVVKGSYLEFEFQWQGGVSWWDFEFEGNLDNAGAAAPTRLTWDGGSPIPQADAYATDESGNMALKIPCRPYCDPTFPDTLTVVMYGKMVSSNKTVQVGIGSLTGGQKYSLFLATGDVSKNEVKLCIAHTLNEPSVELCTMGVPNAQSANHLYAFVLKTVGGNTVINTYLDGELLQPYTYPGKITLGTGFQIGAIHGGVGETGYARPTGADAGATLDVLLAYDVELNQAVMTRLTEEYPYVPPNGSYRRDVTGDATWNLLKAWKKEGTATVTNTPAVGSTVKIGADSEVSLGVNLTADATYGAIEISGGGPLTIAHVPGYAGKVRSSGRVTVKTDAVFSHAAFDMAGAPLTVEDGCTVTFDMSDVELDVWSPVSYDLTGLVTTGKNAQVVCTCGAAPTGRSTWYGIDPADSHFKFHVDVAGPLVAEVTGNTTFDDLKWKVNGEGVQPNFEKTVYATISNRAEGATLTFGSDLASRDSVLTFGGKAALNLAANEGVSVAGVSYDFRGLDAKATFEYDPTPSKVFAGHVRYDLDMGTKNYGDVIGGYEGVYEFRKVELNGAGSPDYTVRVPEGDEVTLANAVASVNCGTSVDVCGGTLYLGASDNAAIWYGVGGTRFNMSAGQTIVRATGQGQTGNGNGLLLGYDGAPSEFNVSGGILDVSESSINFWTAGATNNITGGKVKAKGAFCGNKAPGVINLSGEGVLEVGALGVTTNACTLNLNGGILRGYEAGAAFKSPVVQKGATTVSSTEGADITMGGTFTGSNLIAISEGTVKLGVASGLGTGALTVASGATFDVNGFKPGNAIRVSGTGASGAGALANTGGEVSIASTLTLVTDATIGGTGTIKQSSSKNLKLGGHTLTIAGKGVVYMLGAGTVQGGGQIVAGDGGTLASNGATKLGENWECDLTVKAGGTLDLSHGSHISCRNFTNAGTIMGETAAIIVYGTLDASHATTLPKLTLQNNATLKSGTSVIQLTVTTTNLTIGATLNVDVANPGANIKLATVPTDTPIKSGETTLNVKGGSGTYTLSLQGTSLLASVGGGNYADVALSSVLPWTNFESLKIDGSLANMRVISAGQTNIDVLVTYESGVVTTQRFVYAGGPDGKFTYVVDGVRPGERYDVSAYVLIDTVCISTASTNVNAMTARTLGAWIDEDSQTFAQPITSTGIWEDNDKIASAKGDTIVFAAATRDQQLSFTSTNRAQIAEMGALKEIRISETFTAAAYGVGEEGPALPSSAGLVAVAMTTNAQGECQFAVATNGAWRVIGREVVAPSFNKPYEIVVRIDENAGTVAYGAVDDESSVWLVTEEPYTPAESSAVVQFVFTGAGRITKIDGQCSDANLMQVTIDKTTREYATFEEALAAAGADNAITPLWLSNYEVTGERGAFCVVNNGYFEPIFAKWYRYEKTTGPVQDSYCYVAANNWIEYSDKSGVEREANGAYRVMSEPGLAWIAEQATNGVFEGAVTLGADLDLSSKNWTPIANFTGSFDGKGYVIEGLNNTNVVIDPLLGEAGHYYGGVTNASGYTAYGLFGCTKDAAFRNITLRDVAISNTADSVAALVGVHALGDLTIENVTNESGIVWGEGNVVAGLVTIGGEGGEIGNVVVTNNVNGTWIEGGEDANLAQILAGTSADTKFTGTVDATGNAGEEVPVSLYLYMPICNFAAAIECYDEQMDYWRYVEANEKKSVPIDPVKRTARMLAGFFDNGTTNYMGQWTDAITASTNGTALKVPGTGATIDGWSTIAIDRDLTLDLNQNAIYCVYDCDVFYLANGVAFTIKNGTVYSVEGYEAFAGDTTGLTQENVTLVELSEDFYHRTVPPSSLDVANGSVKIVVPHSSVDFNYILESQATLGGEWSTVKTQTGTGGALSFEVPATGDQCFYRIRMGE